MCALVCVGVMSREILGFGYEFSRLTFIIYPLYSSTTLLVGDPLLKKERGSPTLEVNEIQEEKRKCWASIMK